jgi:deoxyribodipyrimidine photolyase
MQTLSPAPTGRADAPRSAGAARKPSLLWFRADLRLDDNEALVRATAESSSVLPVYCFDPRDFAGGPACAPRVGAARAAFLLECVAELRSALRARGSDLLVRCGRPETVLPALARAVGAGAVYAHAEVSAEELAVERDVARALDGLGAHLRCLWGSTLHHEDDLPFAVADMPANYAAFRTAVTGAPVRAAVPVPGTLRRTPVGSPEPGDMPTLKDLGVAAPPAALAPPADVMRGGEAEARRRLAAFATHGTQAANGAAPRAGGEGMYGASFSCKISPWLAVGCLSPRRLYEELRAAHGGASAPGALAPTAAGPSAAAAPAAATNLNWLVFEVRRSSARAVLTALPDCATARS